MAIYNPATRNNDVGLYFEESGRITVGDPIGKKVCWITAATAGDIVWRQLDKERINVISIQAGQFLPIKCDIILSSGLVDGVTEDTTATGLQWAIPGA